MCGWGDPSRTGTKILRVLSHSVVSAIASDPYSPNSQTPLTPVVVLLGRCPSFHLLGWDFLGFLKGGLLL